MRLVVVLSLGPGLARLVLVGQPLDADARIGAADLARGLQLAVEVVANGDWRFPLSPRAWSHPAASENRLAIESTALAAHRVIGAGSATGKGIGPLYPGKRRMSLLFREKEECPPRMAV